MKVKVIITVVIIYAVSLVWYFYPKQYTETLHGIYYQLGNEDVSEDVKVHIDGQLRRHISGKKTFEGTIEFEGEGIPQVPEDRSKLKLYYDSTFWGTIVSHYRAGVNGIAIPDIFNYGILYANDDFSQFTIMVYSTDNGDESILWSETDGSLITAPASSREEALEIHHKIERKISEMRSE